MGSEVNKAIENLTVKRNAIANLGCNIPSELITQNVYLFGSSPLSFAGAESTVHKQETQRVLAGLFSESQMHRLCWGFERFAHWSLYRLFVAALSQSDAKLVFDETAKRLRWISCMALRFRRNGNGGAGNLIRRFGLQTYQRSEILRSGEPPGADGLLSRTVEGFLVRFPDVLLGDFSPFVEVLTGSGYNSLLPWREIADGKWFSPNPFSGETLKEFDRSVRRDKIPDSFVAEVREASLSLVR